MRYSRAIKESVLKKVLPPEKRSVREVGNEYGISEQTIRNWIEQVSNGILSLDSELGPKYLSSAEKFHLVLEAAGIPEGELGAWIREKGLHSEHLQLWQQELYSGPQCQHKIYPFLSLPQAGIFTSRLEV